MPGTYLYLAAPRSLLTDYSLSKGRRKRPIPEGWVTSDGVSAFDVEATNSLPVPQATSLDVESTTAALGGLKGDVSTYSIDSDKLERHLSAGEPVTATLSTASSLICATAQGSVKVFEGENLTAEAAEHSGAATALSLHPGGRVLASVGSDKSITFYDSASLKRISRAYTDSGMFG